MLHRKFLIGPVRFLHLTDCHLTGHHAEPSSWRAFCRFVEELSSQQALDFIFITGDLSDKNRTPGYDAANGIIPMLAGAAGLPLSSVYVVPGNHDVNRDQANLLSAGPENLSGLLGVEATRAMIEMPFTRYLATTKACGVAAADLKERVTPTARKDVCLLLFNTAWLCRRSDTDQGQLSVAVERWEAALAEGPPPDDRLVIALMHHGPEWLTPREAKQLRRLLTKWADLVLCGHEHEEDVYKIQVSGFSFVLVKGASIARGSMPYLRANLGTVEVDGTVRFDRVLQDPDRAGTPDEWVLARSKDPLRIDRVNESKMRSFAPTGIRSATRQLRDSYRERFSKDRLIGYDSQDQSKDLLLIYRKLSMSRFRSDDIEQSQTVLWYRLNQVLELGAIAEILARCHALIVDTPLDELINSKLTSRREELLTGHRAPDQDRIARATVQAAFERHLQAAQEHLRRAGGQPLLLSLDVVLRTLGHCRALFQHAVRRLCEDLSRGQVPTASSMSEYLWLYLIRHAALRYCRENPPEAGADGLTPGLLDRVDRLIDLSLTEESHGVLGPSAAVPSDARYMSLLRDIARPPAVVGMLRDEEVQHLLHAFDADDRARMLVLYPAPEVGGEDAAGVSNGQDPERLRDVWVLLVKNWDSLAAGVQDKILASLEASNPVEELSVTLADPPDLLMRTIEITAMEMLAWSARGTLTGRVSRVASVWVSHAMDRLHRQFLQDLPDRIHRHLPEGVRQTLSHYNAPALAYDRLMQEKIDRDSLLAQARSMVVHAFGRALSESVSVMSMSLEEVRASARSIAILGGPGSGKTTLLRHLCLTCSNEEIPIFVPLRLWNSQPNLLACIQQGVREAGLEYDQFESQISAADEGSVIFLLDGLDEVKDLSREKSREIENFVGQYSRAKFILTSRFGTADLLPTPELTPQYSLNHLTTEDVMAYLEAWFGAGRS